MLQLSISSISGALQCCFLPQAASPPPTSAMTLVEESHIKLSLGSEDEAQRGKGGSGTAAVAGARCLPSYQ